MSGYRSKWLGIVSITAAIAACLPAYADEQKTLTLDGRRLQSMRIVAGAGFLHVQGVEGTEQIEVTATIVGDRDGYRLTLEEQGSSAVLISEHNEWGFFKSGHWPRIDLTVKVPSRLALDIKDGSGDLVLSAMKGTATINDGSGSLSITGHRGNIDLVDGSGDISLQAITGNIRVEDGSGSMVAGNIIGNLDIRDGSGSIKVNNVDGHVSIHDGSGGINVADIKQGLTISDSGSGGLTMARIEKGIDIDD